MRAPRFFVCLAAVAVAGSARAVPAWQSATDTVDDATITLYVLDQTIVPDQRSPCRLEVSVDDADVSWTDGDEIELWVYENDLLGDDEVWTTTVTVTAADLDASGRFVRTFDCSADFQEDGFGSNLELYAQAEVRKDECGFFCVYDRPETGEIASAEVEDDGREDDDTAADGTAIGTGRTNDGIAVDADFFRVTTTGVSALTVDVLHDPGAGRLTAALFDEGGAPLSASVTDGPDRTTLTAEPLAAGTYAVRITPVAQEDPNFYDLDVAIDAVQTECSPGETDTRACGMCGTDTRTCGALGTWDDWTGCAGEGVCSPGETETEDCGGGAERERTCADTCEWLPFGACEPTPCSPGETVACYTGPDGTEGVGACQAGVRTCVDGVFSECTGQTLPAAEDCTNGIDDDCDGFDDRRDDDCDTGLAGLGEPCTSDDDCDPRWICLGDPDPERFVDGYCGDDADCTGEPDECTAYGLCADLGDSDYCLARCGGAVGCRLGYVCAELPEGEACVPRCRDDADCPDPDFPICDPVSDQCVADEGGGDPGDGPGDTGPVGTLQGCGCASGSGPVGAGWAILVALGLRGISRRGHRPRTTPRGRPAPRPSSR